MCSDCGINQAHSRGLCAGCYSAASRSHSLDDYPTQKFLDNPDAHVRWAFGLPDGAGIELIQDIAVEFGYRLDKAS